MNIAKLFLPILLIMLGIIILLITNMAIPAGVCILLGIIMIFECIWPEKWESDIQDEGNRAITGK